MKVGDLAAGPNGVGEVVGIENGVAVQLRLLPPRGQPGLTRTVASAPSDRCRVVQLREEREAELDL